MSENAVPLPMALSHRWLASLRARLSSESSGELIALYAVHAATISAPLVIVPYATRVLGPAHWGIYSIYHSLALYASMLMEYGFNLSATREVARLRDSAPSRARLLADVSAAKVILAILLLACLSVAGLTVPSLAGHHDLMMGAAIFALGQGASMIWYFQGAARVRSIASLEIGGRVFAIALTLYAVRDPQDAWLILVINGVSLMVVAVITGVMAARECGVATPTLSGAVRTLKEGFSLFLFRGAVSLYTLANAFVLGLLAPAASVGFYAGAERINKGLIGFLNPLIQAYYSRLSHAATGPQSEYAELRKRAMYMVVGAGLLLGAVLFIGAPWWVRIILGPGYEPAVNVLRVLSLLAPLSALSTSLGVHGLLPLGRDRAFNTIIVLAGFFNIGVAMLLAPRWRHDGMSVGVVLTECFVTLAFLFDLYRNRSRRSAKGDAR